ncbi:MAG: hypothetical protein DF168_00832 [Candidatus Moanabacter tarae]|uniref:Glycosyl hydrolase-like 10 domain-containing protein n=1 Tax=Candidatus Moanibacter tarae TaxID=2200854 RepID=A0A2Z4AC47_9BACT|nr:MAG: hypothetical protein DF168_00832 [Candidatus Moanabacter tarae]
MNLSNEHLVATNRERRIIFQDDILANSVFRSENHKPDRLTKIVDFYMSRFDSDNNQIDSVWHEWGEGNTAVWPSKILPRTENVFPGWWSIDVDPIDVLLKETRKRGREVFLSYRINGSDNDRLFDPPHSMDQPIPIKKIHPEWLLRKWHAYWNFEVAEVRELKLRILLEMAEMYDFDGINIDFARVPILFKQGKQWECRDLLTDFMRQLRSKLLSIGRHRNRPFLLAARVPENLVGCHFDGIDIETWVKESILDIIVVGTRTAKADVVGFRNITDRSRIKIYPSWDDHHSSDGYRHPSLEIWRGVCANWWRQGADGMHTFNLMMGSPKSEQALGIKPAPRHRGGEEDCTDVNDQWKTQCQVFSEIGNTETLKFCNKIFFVERRGGGHNSEVVPDPNNWYTPRHMYFQSNMQANLPMDLCMDSSTDRLLEIEVSDHVSNLTENVKDVFLLLAYSIASKSDFSLAQSGKEDQILLEVRINNLLLDPPQRVKETKTALNTTFDHWLQYKVPSKYLALGVNLIGTRPCKIPIGDDLKIFIEKLELHVIYN